MFELESGNQNVNEPTDGQMSTHQSNRQQLCCMPTKAFNPNANHDDKILPKYRVDQTRNEKDEPVWL